MQVARVLETPAPSGERALPAPGDIVADRYRVVRAIGRGGMGAVFEAEHLGLARRVALKILAINAPAAAARFVREARAAARLEGEHIVRVLDVGVDGNAPFFAMELLSGADLYTLVSQRGPLPLAEAIDYVLQACEALAEAHAQGIVHRDLKPSNLFLTRRADGSPLVKLLDFGIAKAPASEAWSQGHLTSVVEILGSPPYMSPEHLRDAGSVDARTDLWSLGVTLHELLTGRHPFEAENAMQLGARIALEAPTPLRAHWPGAPAAIERAIARCLEKDPAARFPTVAELARALEPYAADTSRACVARIEQASAGVASAATMVAVPRPTPQRPPPSEAATRASNDIASGARLRVRGPTDRFRRQHEELQALGFEIASKLRKKTLAENAREVRLLVARFAGKLAVHASMENEALYPRLLAHADPSVRDKARALFDEVGAIYDAFGAYAKRWPTSASIEADVSGFVDETRTLLMTLASRMVRENDELYPLVDAVDTR